MSFVLPECERRYPCRPIEHARFVRLPDVIALLPADMMTLHSFAAPAILRETTGVPVPAELLRGMSRVLAPSTSWQLLGVERTSADQQVPATVDPELLV